MVLDPVVDRMERRGWKRTYGAAFIFLSFLVVSVGIVILAEPYVVQQAGDVQHRLEQYFPDTSHAGLLASFKKMNVSPTAAALAVRGIELVQNGVQRSNTPIAGFAMDFASNFVGLIVIPVVAFYILRDFHVILAKALLLVPSQHRGAVQTGVAEVTAVFGKYLRGMAILSLLNGVATAVLLSVLHVPSALLLGVVAGLLYGVPYVGATLTVVFTACIAFVGGGVHLLLIAVGASFLLHQVLFDQIVTPRILGQHVGLHPILSIIALLMGNALLGVVGMILAVPVAACIQIAVIHMVPKLAVEVQLPDVETATQALAEAELEADEAAEQGNPVDATHAMREAVATVVADIELQAAADSSDADAGSS
jgi:predicted PurR-regulated permease PerM